MTTDKSREGLQFPSVLVLRLVEDETGAPAPGVAVTLRLFAKRKNHYSLGPPPSDADGMIMITEDWVRRGVEHVRNSAIMDYSSRMEECLPHVLVKIMSEGEISNAMRAMRLYKIEKGAPAISRTMDDLMRANNELYEPQESSIGLNTPGISTKEIEIRLRRLK